MPPQAVCCVSPSGCYVAADLVLADLIDHHLFRQTSAGSCRRRPVLFSARFFFQKRLSSTVITTLYWLRFWLMLSAPRSHFDLLRFFLPCDGEFNVIALAQPAELVDLIVIARNQGSHLAACHLQVFARGVQVGRTPPTFGVHVLEVIRGGLRCAVPPDRAIQLSQFLGGFVVELSGFSARVFNCLA